MLNTSEIRSWIKKLDRPLFVRSSFLIIAALLTVVWPGEAATVVVSNDTQLVAAVNNNNGTSGGGDVIVMNAGMYSLSGSNHAGGDPNIGLDIANPLTLTVAAGAAVTLNFSTNYGIRIIAPNVVLNGFTISGIYFGVSAYDVRNLYGGTLSGIVIRGLTVSTNQNGQAISTGGVVDSIIENCTITSTYNNGIVLDRGGPANASSNRNLVINNSVTNTAHGSGVAVNLSDNNTVAGNIFSNVAFNGVFVNGGQHNYVGQNTMDNGLTFTKETGSGRQALRNLAVNNTITLKSQPGSDALWFNYDANYNLGFLNDGSVSGEGGMALFNSTGNYLRANNLHNNAFGGIVIRKDPGSGSTTPSLNSIQQNYFHDNNNNGGITTSTETQNDYGFNYLSGNPNGIQTSGTTNSFFYSNVIRNSGGGEQLQDSTSGATFYLNRHFNVPNHFVYTGNSGNFDSGSTVLGGNYYSDFTSANGNPSNGATPYTNFYDQNAGTGVFRDRYPYASESLGKPYNIALRNPSAGSYLAASTSKTIAWSSQGCVEVDLYLADLNGNPLSTIASNAPDYGYYRWTVPAVAAGQYRVRADCKTSAGAATGNIDIGPVFQITSADLILLSPQTNLMQDAGAAMQVSWKRSSAVSSVDIYIRYADSQAFTLLQGGVTADFYTIPVPTVSSNRVSVRLISGSFGDSTDGWFTIRGSSSGMFTAPASGSTLVVGTPSLVEWVSPQGTDYVTLDLITGSGTKNIVTQLGDFSSYLMLVPDMQGSGETLRLTCYSSTGTVLQQISSPVFSSSQASAPVVTADSISPNSGTGNSQVFSAVFSDTAGASNLASEQILINNALNNSGACSIYVNSAGFYLFNDAGSTLMGPAQSGTLANSQCSLSVGSSSVSTSGNSRTVSVSLTFAQAFGGIKNLFLTAADSTGHSSGFQNRGTFTIPLPVTTPTSDSISPNSGSGSSQAFSVVYSDSDGYGNLTSEQLLINSSLTNTGACSLYVNGAGFYLFNDAGNSLMGPAAPGGTLSNSQCTFSQAGSSVSESGASRTVVFNLSFAPGFGGNKSLFLYDTNASNHNSGFQNRGTYTVPGAATTPSAVTISPNSGAGNLQAFTATYSDSAGASNLTSEQLLINSSLNNSGACSLYLNSSGFYLFNDAGNSLLGPAVQGGTLANSQCTFIQGGSSSTDSGTTRTVVFNLSFTSNFAGAKSLYLYTTNKYSNNSGFQNRGTYTIPLANTTPTADSISPNSGSGPSQSFTAIYSDANGYGNLTSEQLLINSVLSNVNACSLYVNSSGFYLFNDAGNTLAGPASPGGTLSNSQCTFSQTGSSVSGSGNSRTVVFNLSFSTAFGGTKTLFAYAINSYNNNSGFQNRGTFMVPFPPSTPTADSISPNTAAGAAQAFTAVYSDSNGYANLASEQLLINSSLSNTNACSLYMNNSGFYLFNDAGTVLMGPAAQGGTLSNGQCTLSQAGSSISGSGSSRNVVYSLTFSNAFHGAKSLYLYDTNSSGNNSGFQNRGSYTIQ